MQFDKKTIAHRMKVLRAERNLNQEDLATASGLNVGTIARYETAESGMTLESACKLADAFGLKHIEDLLSRPVLSGKEGE
jgi:transcriptional regulator with XRE-family HTH domain